MTGKSPPVLLVTANVGSIFEDVSICRFSDFLYLFRAVSSCCYFNLRCLFFFLA
jgi:hypothetical protein